MKWKTPEPRPYYSNYEKVEIENGQGWYDCYRLPGDIYAVCEPQHLQEVNSFLIFGEKRALLIDTGMGICDIRPVIQELCGAWEEERTCGRGGAQAAAGRKKGEQFFETLEVVNCHCHFDHTGNNWRFDRVRAADTPLTRRTAAEGLGHGPLASQSDEDMFLFGYPDGFDPEQYRVRPYRFEPCPDGYIFDLGGRQVEFITTPGHTEDHAMLYDHREKILFAGDMIYFGAIYAQFNNDLLGHSDMREYVRSLRKVRDRCPDLRRIYVSHNDFITDPAAIEVIAEAMTSILEGRVRGLPLRDEKYGYYMDPPQMRQFMFDGFSIVAMPPGE